MEEAIKYKNVIREYFLEYKNRDQVLKSIFYVILFGCIVFAFCIWQCKGRAWVYMAHISDGACAVCSNHTYECPADDAVSRSRIEKAARGIYPENVKG